MKRALVVLPPVLVLAACGNEPGEPDTNAQIVVTWTLATPTRTVACEEVGATSIRVDAIDQEDGQPVGGEILRCNAAGAVLDVNGGAYLVVLETADPSGATLEEASVLTAVSDEGVATESIEISVLRIEGRVLFTWGAQCGDGDRMRMTLDPYPPGLPGPHREWETDCASTRFLTPLLPGSTYYTFELLWRDRNGAAIDTYRGPVQVRGDFYDTELHHDFW